jgi:hypothetical protein
LHNAELPNDLLPAFNASYFLALHKKVGLQPILIGTSLKRILGTMESSAFASNFASSLCSFSIWYFPAQGDAVPYYGYP